MKIDKLEVGQMVSDGVQIAEVKFSEEFKTKYYAYIREQEEDDEQDDSIIFVIDMEEDYLSK
jgi:hypothetical protein